MEKMTRIERAKQFLPFNALRGYYTLIKEKEKTIQDKKTLSEDELERLQREYEKLSKGSIVKLKYYNIDHYEVLEGMISKIDLIERKICVVKKEIFFDDIIDLNF